MTDERKDLPPVNSPNFLEKVREALSVYLGNRGDGLDRGLTLRDLTEAGIVTLRSNFGRGNTRNPIGGPGSAIIDELVYEADLTPPPTPTGFVAASGITTLLLECDPQTYTQGHGHAKSKLYGATWTTGPLPVFADAVVITEFSGTVASHATNPATTWHLWLTWVTVDGVESTTPAGGTNGVVTRTGEDVALLLEALTGEITESQLYADLGARIDLIDTPTTGLVDALAAAKLRLNAVDTPVTGLIDRLEDTNDALILAAADATAALDSILDINAAIADLQGTPDYAAGTTYAVGDKVKYSGNIYQATSVTTGNLPTNTAFWTNIGAYVDSAALAAIVGGHTTSINTLNGTTTALTTQSDLLASQVNSSLAGLSQEQLTRATNDSALSSQVVTLAASTAAGAAGLQVEQTARADAASALAQQVTTLAASTGGNTAALVLEQTARADAASALSNQITSLTATTGDSIAGLITEQTARTDASGALASQLTTLGATTAASSAAISLEQEARTTETSALASQVSTLAAQAGVSLAGITLEQETRTTETSALAAQVSNVTAALGTNTALVQTVQSSSAEADAVAASQMTTLKAVLDGNMAGIQEQQTARINDAGSLASQLTSLVASTGGNSAALVTTQQASATADAALSSQLSTLVAQTGANLAGITSAQSASTTADTALAARATTLEAAVTDLNTGLASKASIAYVDQAEADAVSASATSIQQVQSKVTAVRKWEKTTVVNGNSAALITSVLFEDDGVTPLRNADQIFGSSKGEVTYTVSARVTATGTQTGAVSVFTSTWNGSVWVWTQLIIKEAGTSSNHVQLYLNGGVPSIRLYDHATSYGVAYNVECDVGGFSSAAAVKVEATTRATQTGELYAQYTVKLDVGGKVSGYGLASSSTSSEFAIRADRFYIAPPATGGGTATQIIPFAVQATATTINGVAVPAGVYINEAFIKNGTITTAKIGNAQIDNAKISDLSATKITAGSIGVSTTISSTADYPGGGKMWSIDGAGNATFNNAVVRGTVYATDGFFGGTLQVGSSPAVSSDSWGPTMSGSGVVFNANGTFALGASASYIAFNSGILRIRGFQARYNSGGVYNVMYSGAAIGSYSMTANPAGSWIAFTPKNGNIQYTFSGKLIVTTSSPSGVLRYLTYTLRLSLYNTSGVMVSNTDSTGYKLLSTGNVALGDIDTSCTLSTFLPGYIGLPLTAKLEAMAYISSSTSFSLVSEITSIVIAGNPVVTEFNL